VHLDVLPLGRELALLVDAAPARRVPLGRGELERVAAVEREERLHEPLAEARRAHEQRAVVVLQRAGDDLARRRRAAVDHDHERDGRAHRLLGGHVHLRLALPPRWLSTSCPRLRKRLLVADRLLEDAARVAAQVEDHPFGPRASSERTAWPISSAVLSLKRCAYT
jgi:hypothetical protein